MKLHYLQHVPFEGLGFIAAEWGSKHHIQISCTRLFAGDAFPDLSDMDALVIMGGSMGIYDEEEFPWLREEKIFIRKAIDAELPILGICLGAQLLADVLGAKVYPNTQKEIGWFPIQRSTDAPDWLPPELTVFHWHGDTFDLPEGAIHLASSEATPNQGFFYKDHVVALQFHLETTPESMNHLIENCGAELSPAPFVQTAEQMQSGIAHLSNAHQTLETLLDPPLSQMIILNSIAPIFLLILLGRVLQHTKFVPEGFFKSINRLVFWFALPSLLIHRISAAELQLDSIGRIVAVLTVATLLSMAIAWQIARLLKLPAPKTGAFIQGAFRGNGGLYCPARDYIFFRHDRSSGGNPRNDRTGLGGYALQFAQCSAAGPFRRSWKRRSPNLSRHAAADHKKPAHHLLPGRHSSQHHPLDDSTPSATHNGSIREYRASAGSYEHRCFTGI